MEIIEGEYRDFDLFRNDVKDWGLEFNILSSKDFYAKFKMFTSENLLLSKEVLNGKIAHRGLAPLGYRTLVIPGIHNDSEIIWYNKLMQNNEILLFPKNNIIDAVTFNGLDIFLISIKETKLYNTIDTLGLLNCIEFFNSDKLRIKIDNSFISTISTMSDAILNSNILDIERIDEMLNDLMFFILNYIEDSKPIMYPKDKIRKSIALTKAVEIINNEQDVLYTVQDLCGLVGVSEKTLFSAFKEKYRVSPSEYLKSLRLNKVKNEIESNKCQDNNISTIAGKYHFWHMGQFAKDFKKQFGILPSDISKHR